jgi:hypothetical protein
MTLRHRLLTWLSYWQWRQRATTADAWRFYFTGEW